MAETKIRLKTEYDGKGEDEARRALERLRREEVAATRGRIQEHRNVSRLTRQLDRDMERERRQQQRKPGLSQQIGNEFSNRLGAGIVLGSVLEQSKEFISTSIELANQAKVTETAFLNLSGGTAEAAENMAAMTRATRGLASEQEQQAIANQLLGMQLADNDEELEKIVNGSRRLGAAFKGMGTAEAANEFALLLSNMSFMRLDQFGLSSGKVRDRVNELKDAGMSAEEAFKTAVFEEMDKTLERLGPEVETNAQKVERLAARWTDFKTAFGTAAQDMSDATGTFETLTGLVEGLTKGAEAWSGIAQQQKIVGQSLDELNSQLPPAAQGILRITEAANPFGAGAAKAAELLGHWIFNQDKLNEVMTRTGEEITAQNAVVADNSAEVEKNAEEWEKLQKRLEETREIRRDAMRDLLETEEDAQKDSVEAWEDYNKSVTEAAKEGAETEAKIKADSAKDQLKAEKDLQKDLAKIKKDTAKDKAKVDTDAEKQINRLKADAAKEEKQQAKLKQIDALADERLFQFELRQLAAEGQGNAIKAALERREIEQEIAAEKAEAEAQIEDEKQQDQIDRIKESAAKEKAEIDERAKERQEELEAQAEEEKAARQEQLTEALEEERQSHIDRLTDLQNYRQEKLAEIEASREEAIAALGEELAEAGDLTKSELGALAEDAGKLGENVGKSFAEGVNKGYEENNKISDLLTDPGTGSAEPGKAPNPSQIGATPPKKKFAQGGTFTVGGAGGVDSQFVGFMATPGEKVTVSPPGQAAGGSINLNVSGLGGERLAAYLMKVIEQALQQYTDDVIQPALG